jgi:ankyrin repeat protein
MTISSGTYPPGAMIEAAKRGDIDAAVDLLRDGAEIDERDSIQGMTPLMWALLNGHGDFALFAISHNANVNALSYQDRTPLMFAADSRHEAEALKVMEVLVREGARIDAKDENGDTPFTNAAWGGHYGAAKFLLEKKADVNIQTKDGGWTALMGVAEHGFEDLLDLLITYKARTDLTNDDGETALDLATAQLDIAPWEDPDFPLSEDKKAEMQEPKEWMVQRLKEAAEGTAAAMAMAAADARSSEEQSATAAENQKFLRDHAPKFNIKRGMR